MNITKKSDYEEYVKYFQENDLETFYRDYESLNSNLKESQFAVELIMPEKLFDDVLMSTIKKLRAINLLNGIKDIGSGGFDTQQMYLLNIINNLTPVEIEPLCELMAKAFMTTPELAKIRIKQLYCGVLVVENISLETKKEKIKLKEVK